MTFAIIVQEANNQDRSPEVEDVDGLTASAYAVLDF